MSGSGKVGNGRGNNRRHPFRRRNNDASQETSSLDTGASQRNNVSPRSNTQAEEKKNQDRGHQGNPSKRTQQASTERPKWIPPKLNIDPLPVPDCPICNKPIRDLLSAISDRNTGAPAHFDCVAAKIAGAENLEKGDTITSQDRGTTPGNREFRIKKIIEWENKDKRAEWRSLISEHYSVT